MNFSYVSSGVGENGKRKRQRRKSQGERERAIREEHTDKLSVVSKRALIPQIPENAHNFVQDYYLPKISVPNTFIPGVST